MQDKFEAFLTVASDALNREYDVADHPTSRYEQYLAAIDVILAVHALRAPEFDGITGAFVCIVCENNEQRRTLPFLPITMLSGRSGAVL